MFFCGPSCLFTNDINPRSAIQRQFKETIVKYGSSIGANSTIFCGITIGRFSLIGAGAVVTKSILDYSIVVGNPARRIGWACECGEKINELLVCERCSKRYIEVNGKLNIVSAT
jgi:UDP-2-acetamido-3-amino-2,3-dideoxy-glucuronate N-acetyltransferase